MSANGEFRLTPDVLQLVRQRAALGDFDWEIAGRVGCDQSTLRAICEQHGYSVRGLDAPVTTITVGLSRRPLERIAREAAARNLTPQQLATQILDAVGKDRLFAAILDS